MGKFRENPSAVQRMLKLYDESLQDIEADRKRSFKRHAAYIEETSLIFEDDQGSYSVEKARSEEYLALELENLKELEEFVRDATADIIEKYTSDPVAA